MKIGILQQIIIILLTTTTMFKTKSVSSLSIQRQRLRRLTKTEFNKDFNDMNYGDTDNCESDGKCKVNFILQDPARHATNIALKAAEEAKKANDEMSLAVLAAGRKVKLEYAEKAAYAAKAAEAALAGKQQILEQLESEVREGEIIVQEQMAAVSNAQENFEVAKKAVDLAKAEYKVIINAIKLAKDNYDTSQLVTTASKESVNEKYDLFEAAKNRVFLLLRQLKDARLDFENTKKAAIAAACAAQEARHRSERNRRSTDRRKRYMLAAYIAKEARQRRERIRRRAGRRKGSLIKLHYQ